MVNHNHDKKGKFCPKETKESNHKKPIDWEQVSRLAELQCTAEEIAFVCKITRQTLYNRCQEETGKTWPEYLEENRQGGKASLRRLQWEKATGREGVVMRDDNGKICFDDKNKVMWKCPPIPPDTTMQIWLGKQYLGQTDKQETALTGKDGGPITITEVEVVKS